MSYALLSLPGFNRHITAKIEGYIQAQYEAEHRENEAEHKTKIKPVFKSLLKSTVSIKQILDEGPCHIAVDLGYRFSRPFLCD